MPKYKPLKYRDVATVLKNLGFQQMSGTGSSHQTWVLTRDNVSYAVTAAFHGANKEFKRGTLDSMIRQSGYTKKGAAAPRGAASRLWRERQAAFQGGMGLRGTTTYHNKTTVVPLWSPLWSRYGD